jgi:uncharacterized membrane protein
VNFVCFIGIDSLWYYFVDMTPRRKGSAKKDTAKPERASLRTAAIFAQKMNDRRSYSQKAADALTQYFGRMWFLLANGLFFLVWVLVNVGAIPFIPVFDPFPFFLLTTFVSLEAILLAVTVLISENRAARVAELREEMDFQVNVQSEREITKILHMVDEIRTAMKMKSKHDPELAAMKETIDVDRLGEEIEEEMG